MSMAENDNFQNQVFLAKWFKVLVEALRSTLSVKVTNPNDIKTTINIPEVKFPETQKVKGKVTVDNFEDISLNVGDISLELPQKQEVKGKVTVDNLPKIQKVTGSVNVKEFPKIQKVKGTVGVDDIKPISKLLKEVSKKIDGIKLKLPKKLEVTGIVRVANLPKKQQVTGTVAIESFKPLIEGLQIIVDELQDLKMEVKMAPSGGSTVIAGTSGGAPEARMKGTTLFDPNDSKPIYIGQHENVDADTGDDQWTVIKYTYSGDNATKIVRKKGVWNNRTSL